MTNIMLARSLMLIIISDLIHCSILNTNVMISALLAELILGKLKTAFTHENISLWKFVGN